MFSKKSELDSKVNSNGFALFVLGLTLAGFLGGALRFFLNSERAQQKILSEVQKKFPEWNVVADSARLHLAAGIWPGVTIELPQASVFRKGRCGEPSFRVKADHLKIPMSLWAILSGKGRVGDVRVSMIDLKLEKSPCAEDVINQPQADLTGPSSPALKEIKSFGLRSIYEDLRKRGESLTLDQVYIHSDITSDWSVGVKNLKLDTADVIEMSGSFSLWQRLKQGEIRQNFKFLGKLQGSLLEWSLSTPLKEGALSWTGQLDEDGRTFLQKVNVSQGPLGDLLELIYKFNFMKHLPQARRSWLNCELVQGGSFSSLKELRELPIRMDHCSLDGELGRIHIDSQVFYLTQPYLRNGALSMKVNQLSIEYLSDILNWPKHSVVISKLGTWTGTLNLTPKEHLEIDGEIEGLKLNVSNKSLRGVETISKIRTQGELSAENLNLKFGDFHLLGGSRGGEAQVNYQFSNQAGDFKLVFEALRLSDSVQQVLIQGRASPLKLKLDGQITDGKILKLKGHFESEEAKGPGWNLKSISGNFRQIEKAKFDFGMKAESLAWDDRFKYHSMAASVLKESQFKPQTNLLSQISAGFEVTPTGGKVSNATAFFKGQKAGQKLEFTGGWRRGDHLIGKVRIGTRPWVPVEVGHLRGQVIN